MKKSPGASLNEEAGSRLLAIVIHFNFSCGCCQKVLSHFFSAVVVFSVGVVIFSVAVVTPDLAVATMPQMNVHKERAAGESLISESP